MWPEHSPRLQFTCSRRARQASRGNGGAAASSEPSSSGRCCIDGSFPLADASAAQRASAVSASRNESHSASLLRLQDAQRYMSMLLVDSGVCLTRLWSDLKPADT